MYNTKLQDFACFIGNNDQPSDKVIMALKDAVAETDKQLADIDSQTCLLEERIRELRQNRVKIEEPVAPYRSILSPMRHIPFEILVTIFRHCLATHRNPTMSASEAPMLLTRVCSRWRTITTASPRLWARIQIPFQSEREYGVDTAVQRVQVENYPTKSLKTRSLILQTRCKAIHEWLLRSRDCPLSISIFYATKNTGTDTEILCKATLNLLETIVLFISRWRALELNLPFNVYTKLESMVIHAGVAPSNLEQVRIAVPVVASQFALDFRPIGILKSPALRRISLYLPYNESRSFFDTKALSWSNLTHFSNHTSLLAHEVFKIFKYCPQLIHAQFSLNDHTSYKHIVGTVHLPFLESMWIRQSMPPSSAADDLYCSIHAPLIRWIRYKSLDSDIPSMSDDYEGQSILPLVENSVAGIRILELDPYLFRPDTLHRMMEVPSVSFFLNTLHVHCPYAYYPDSYSHGPDGIIDQVEPFDLNIFTVKRSMDSNGVLGLLPRLEIFALYNAQVSDNAVFDFITSRMDRTLLICVLKKIVIEFILPRDKFNMDLKEEVYRRAEAAGVEIDLTIVYSDTDCIHPLSPSAVGYVFSKNTIADCVTWDYEDVLQNFVVEDDDT